MARRPSLSTGIVNDIRGKISAGQWRSGDQIPIEAELCNQYNVSRTVVREAIARLRSEGLLEARHGIGIFVTDDVPRRFEVDWDSAKSLQETVALLEMRVAIEVEAAALCALRRSDEDIRNLRALQNKIALRLEEQETSYLQYDFDFHITVAKATKNPYFHRFLAFLKPIGVPTINPRSNIDADFKKAYFEAVNSEHAAIVDAIEASDPVASRRMMRTHIENSRVRLTQLTNEYGVEAVGVFDLKQPEARRELARTLTSGKPAT